MDDQEQSPAILSDRVLVDGNVTPLTLSSDGLLKWNENGRERQLSVEKEVLGFSVDGKKVRVKAVVEGGKRICCSPSTADAVREEFVFEPLFDDSRRLWCVKLRGYIDSLGRPKRLLIFVNPFGGKRSASKILLDVVKPMLEDAEINIAVQETKHQLHAKEIASSLDLHEYDGIVCVSGDGVLVEVVNGLLEREDWRDAIRMPIGMVPAGTGNGMVKSLLDSAGLPCTSINATLSIIRGHKRSLDVATILQGETRFFSVLMLAWGLIADIDIESEKYRWLGSSRIDIYALQRILHLRRYNGRILFVPAPGFENFGQPVIYTADNGSGPDKQLSVKDEKHGYQGPDTNLENLKWREINGPFVSVWLHNVPWGAENTMAAPDAKFADGFLDLLLIKDCSRVELLSSMTKLSDGGHVKLPYVTSLKVKAVVLEPGSRVGDTEKGGIIDSDGEVIARGRGTYKCDTKALMSYDKLQIVVEQGLATLFSP